eukprot:374020_1
MCTLSKAQTMGTEKPTFSSNPIIFTLLLCAVTLVNTEMLMITKPINATSGNIRTTAPFIDIINNDIQPPQSVNNSVILKLNFRFCNGFFNHQYYYFNLLRTSPLFSKLSPQSTSINDDINGTSIISHNDSEPDLHFAFNPKTKTNVFDSSTNTQFKYSKLLHSIIAN